MPSNQPWLRFSLQQIVIWTMSLDWTFVHCKCSHTQDQGQPYQAAISIRRWLCKELYFDEWACEFVGLQQWVWWQTEMSAFLLSSPASSCFHHCQENVRRCTWESGEGWDMGVCPICSPHYNLISEISWEYDQSFNHDRRLHHWFVTNIYWPAVV